MTGDSGYGTGEEVRQNWIQGRLQTASSADFDSGKLFCASNSGYILY